MALIRRSGNFRRLIGKINLAEIFNYCIKKSVWIIIVFLSTILIYHLGLGQLLLLIGSTGPKLSATVTCESWKAPWCIDKEVMSMKNRLFKDIAHSDDIKSVLSAKTMYTIKVFNKGDKEASNPILTLDDNLYSEVIRRIGKGDKGNPEEYFMPKEIKLGLIQAGKTVAVEVKAWVSSKPSRRRAKKIEITCEGPAASLDIRGPVE